MPAPYAPLTVDDPRVATSFTYDCRCGTHVTVVDTVPDHWCCSVCGTRTAGGREHRCRIELS